MSQITPCKDTRQRIQALNDVIATCYRGLGAYQGAFRRVGHARIRDDMRALMARHRTTIDALQRVVARLGGGPISGETFRSIDKGKRALRGAVTTASTLVALRAVDEAVWESLTEARDGAIAGEAIEDALRARDKHARWFRDHLSGKLTAVHVRY